MKTLLCALLLAQTQAILPPLPPWNGKTRELIVAKDDRWVTPAETANFRTTPSYAETMTWLRRLESATPQIGIVMIGLSAGGYEIPMVLVSKERRFTPEAMRAKPLVLIQAGIHAGEIDGKDAGMMLLRDMTVRGTKRDLLDLANILFVPIFNPDGHEAHTAAGRINQRGPENAGWRTNAQNLNLNRDYAKLDTPEVAAIVKVLGEWDPDLYIDVHVTDGADYQYDVTYGYNAWGWSPAIAEWLAKAYSPAVDAPMRAAGHVPGPFVYTVTDDPADGVIEWIADPRYSGGYADARHVPSILIENHSLKPYEQRVLGTYVFLEHSIRVVARERERLRAAVRADRASRRERVPLAWDVEKSSGTIEFLGIESRGEPSPISGGVRREFLGRPVTMNVPLIRSTRVVAEATRPRAYWVPAAWPEVIRRLKMHGIRMETIIAPREVELEMYRLTEPKFEAVPFEGRVRVTPKPVIERRKERYAAGSVRIPTDQPLGTLAMLLLEPASPDSFLQWGFFHSVFDRTEYVEGYVIEPMAQQMLANDPALAAEFRRKLADPSFRGNEQERLRWFYERTPHFDERWRLYPVGRER